MEPTNIVHYIAEYEICDVEDNAKLKRGYQVDCKCHFFGYDAHYI